MISFFDNTGTKTIDEYDGTGCSSMVMYICPNDIYIDPNKCVSETKIELEFDLEPIPVQFWPVLYEENPQECPTYYNPAPKKLEFKSDAPVFIHKNYKQPIARSGFKRGQRKLNLSI